MEITFRDYQNQSIHLLQRALDIGANPLCVLPTGGGKSLVLAGLLQQRQQPALVLSHVAELLEQDARALHRVAPGIEQAFFVAGLGEKNPHAQVVFGSVQSVCRSLPSFRKSRPLLLIDEAHLCPRKADAMYATVFAHFMGARRVGFTATATRLDSGSLVDGGDAWFDTIAHEVDVRTLIKDGWLVPLSGIITQAQASMQGVATRGGEFVAEQAAEAVLRTLPLGDAVRQACELAQKRKAWLVFAASIEHAQAVCVEMRAAKIDAAVVTSESTKQHRDETIARFKAGELRALVNVGILTTGFDAPLTDCIVCMRPTKSTVLWQQLLGRGMRTADGKSDCLLLDFVGNLDRLGGVGCVQEIVDRRQATTMRIGSTPRRSGPRDTPALYEASKSDPMRSGALFDAAVNRLHFFAVNSKRFPGKRLLIAAYGLQDATGRALEARAFLCVEYPGGSRYLAEQWFARRGVVAAQVPRSADVALTMARFFDPPEEVRARYDRKLHTYLVDEERFAATAVPAEA